MTTTPPTRHLASAALATVICLAGIATPSVQAAPGKATGTSPEHPAGRTLRASVLFEGLFLPGAEALHHSTSSGPEIASITLASFWIQKPIDEVWEFYARKFTPAGSKIPAWAPNAYGGISDGGRTPAYQYMMFQRTTPGGQMGSFLIHRKSVTIHVQISANSPANGTLVALTADEPLPIPEPRQ